MTAPVREASAQERQQHGVRETDEKQRSGRWVDVRDEVGGVDAQHDADTEHRYRSDSEDAANPAWERVDASVCEEEPDLLQRQPHEGEIHEADPIDAGGHPQHVDGGGGCHEQHEGPHRRTFVGAHEHGQQRLAQQECPQEPQWLTEPVAGDEQQIRGDADDAEGDEGDRGDGDRGHSRNEQSVQSAGDERASGRAPRTRTAVGGVPRETTDDEEQRHHLQHPAQRSDPVRAFARVREHGAGIRERHPDHERVQHDDAQNAQGADEVDAGVADACAWRGGSGRGELLHDGHGILLGGVRRGYERGDRRRITRWCRPSPYRGGEIRRVLRGPRHRRRSRPARDHARRSWPAPSRRAS